MRQRQYRIGVSAAFNRNCIARHTNRKANPKTIILGKEMVPQYTTEGVRAHLYRPLQGTGKRATAFPSQWQRGLGRLALNTATNPV